MCTIKELEEGWHIKKKPQALYPPSHYLNSGIQVYQNRALLGLPKWTGRQGHDRSIETMYTNNGLSCTSLFITEIHYEKIPGNTYSYVTIYTGAYFQYPEQEI